MITVHHLENSQSVRVLWLLEELGVDYQIEHYARDKQTSLAPEALKALHPMGTSPTITDGDTVLAESNAIVMGYCMEVAAVRAGMDARYPNSLAFLERMRARPAYKAAIEKGGPFVPLTG